MVGAGRWAGGSAPCAEIAIVTVKLIESHQSCHKMAPHVVVMRKAWRESGLTLAAIAELSDLSENTVLNVLGGRNARWSSLSAVCRVLRVTTLQIESATSCGNTSTK